MPEDHPVFEALAILLSQCDGAQSLDNVGLNKIDASDYRTYGVRNPDAWAKRLSKYRRQIGDTLADKLRDIAVVYKEQKTLQDNAPFVILGGPIKKDIFCFPVRVDFKNKDRAKNASAAVFGWNVLRWDSVYPKQWSVQFSYIRALVESGKFVLEGITLDELDKEAGNPAPSKASPPSKREEFTPCPPRGKTHADAKIPELLPHQCEGVDIMINGLLTKKAVLNADDMGLGKTLQALAVLKALGSQEKLVVVCPASARFVWVNEILKWTTLTVAVYKNTVSAKKRKEVFGPKCSQITDDMRGSDVLVASYEGLKNFVVDNPDPETSKFHTMKKVIHPKIEEWMSQRILVCDEMQLAKGRKAQRSQATYAVCRAAKSRIALTGTPIMNRPEELWNLLCSLGLNREVAKTRGEFFSRFVYGADHSALNKLLVESGWFVRRLKDKVLNLPPKIRSELVVEMDRTSERAYTVARARLEEEPLAALTDMQTAANLAKVKPLAKVISEHLLDSRPVVVQSTRTEPLFHLKGELKKQGIDCHTLTGADNDTERSLKVQDFQNGIVSVVLTTLDSAITLTKAEVVYLLDLDWSPAKIAQREDRCYRIGQQNPLQVIRVIAAGIDYHKVRVVANKAEIIGNILDGGENEWNQASLMKEVISLIQADAKEETE